MGSPTQPLPLADWSGGEDPVDRHPDAVVAREDGGRGVPKITIDDQALDCAAIQELVYEVHVTARDRYRVDLNRGTYSRFLTQVILEELPPAQAVGVLRAIADEVEARLPPARRRRPGDRRA